MTPYDEYWKPGYKVLLNKDRSVIAPKPLTYLPDVVTSFRVGDGPLTVFDTLGDAWVFINTLTGRGIYQVCRVAYVSAPWPKDANTNPIVLWQAGEDIFARWNNLPPGTQLARAVYRFSSEEP